MMKNHRADEHQSLQLLIAPLATTSNELGPAAEPGLSAKANYWVGFIVLFVLIAAALIALRLCLR